jgi:hypothetical protein
MGHPYCFGSVLSVDSWETNVGAILLLLGALSSSAPPSLVSLLTPEGTVAGTAAESRGVSGGVVMGTRSTLPEFVAATLGTWPTVRDGLLRIPSRVITEEVEFVRVGDDGR